MSKSKRKIDNNQLSIFEYLQNLADLQGSLPPSENSGQFKIVDNLKASIRAAIKSCPLSRHQIAGEMSHLLNETVTKEMLDSWTRHSDEANGHPRRYIPAEFLPAFCKVTRDNQPLIIMGRMVGLFVLPGPEALRAEIQRIDEEIRKAKNKKKKRMMFLKEMESEKRS